MNLKKGDTVILLQGKDKGKKGKIIRVADEKIIVEGINVAKRHQKPSRNFQGGIIEKPIRFFASKAMLVCPRCSEPTRVARKDGVRVCKACSEIIDKD